MYSLIIFLCLFQSNFGDDAYELYVREIGNRWNFVVSFHLTGKPEKFCTGSGISRNLVISASHCFKSDKTLNIYVLSNTVYAEKDKTRTEAQHSIQTLYRPNKESGEKSLKKSDLILVKVTPDLLNFAPLPENQGNLRMELACKTIGWGTYKGHEGVLLKERRPILKKRTEFKILSHTEKLKQSRTVNILVLEGHIFFSIFKPTILQLPIFFSFREILEPH